MADWFGHKRYGYGAGRPISWQGWVLTIVFLAIVIGSTFFIEEKPLAVIGVVVPTILAFILMCARTTQGGWRWRWGDKE